MQAAVTTMDRGMISVRVFGLDALGKPFFQDARARNLTTEGALLEGLEHPLKTGDIVGVQYEQVKVRARIMWACEFAQQKNLQVGIKLVAPKDCPWTSLLSTDGAGEGAGERRRSPRFRVSVSVRIREARSGASLQTNSTDVSVNGCYVQTQLPLAIGSHLDIELWLERDRFATSAIVRTCDPGVGMGVEFIGLSPTELTQLQQALRRLLMDKISGLR